MIISLIHSTEPELEMITLPLSQVRSFAESINRQSTQLMMYRQAVVAVMEKAVVRAADVSIDVEYWRHFISDLRAAREA